MDEYRHPDCDCGMHDLDRRTFSACTHAVEMLNGVGNSHDICIYTACVMIAVQMVHLRKSSTATEEQIMEAVKAAMPIAEKIHEAGAAMDSRKGRLC